MNLRDHLEAIRAKRGTLTGEVVLDEARDPEHPLHHRFEWDDSVAGEKYRLLQATELLRVTYRPNPEKPVELRAYQCVRGESTGRGEYVPTGEALADPFTRQLVLRQARRDAEMFKRRYRHLAEYAEIIASLNQEEAS